MKVFPTPDKAPHPEIILAEIKYQEMYHNPNNKWLDYCKEWYKTQPIFGGRVSG
jgi:hypothetical protein